MPETGVTPGLLPSALRASLRLCQIAPGDLVGIDIATCPACGGVVRIIASIEDPAVIEKILAHLDAKGGDPEAPKRPLQVNSFTKLHHPLMRWGFAWAVGVKAPENRVAMQLGSWDSGRQPHPRSISIW